MNNNKEKIKKVVDTIDQLPPMPGVVVNMLRLINDPDVSYKDLIKNLDVAVGTKLLNVANSAYYRTYQNIQSLEHAFSILGLDAIKNMLIGINVASILTPASVKKSAFDYNKFWCQSVLSAQFSRILAKIIRYSDLSKLYTIGLIHDMGYLLIAQYFPDEFNDITTLVETEGLGICEAEDMIIGMPHSLIGGIMAEKWKLSQEMIDVIKFHANPEKLKEHIEEYKIAVMVNTSEKIINETGLCLTETFFVKSNNIDRFISDLLISAFPHLDKQKVLSEWSDIIFNNLRQIEDEVSMVVGVLLK